MPDRVKEKLVELAKPVLTSLPFPWCTVWRDVAEKVADAYISQGVTVQEWKPITEPPKKDGRYLVYDDDSGNYYDSYFDETEGEFGEWQNCFDPFTLGVIDCEWNSCPNVTHWMPLPQPPKGE